MTNAEIRELEIRIQYLERENAALRIQFLDECALRVTSTMMMHKADRLCEYARIETQRTGKPYSVMKYIAKTSYDMADNLLQEKLSRAT